MKKFQKYLLVAEATNLKKELKRKAAGPDATAEDRQNLRKCLKAISDLRKAENTRQHLKTAQH